MRGKKPPREVPVCAECGKQHLLASGILKGVGKACAGHLSGRREPVPCTQPARKGLTVCRYHGGNTATAIAAGLRRHEAAEAEEREARVARRWGIAVETTPLQAILSQISLWQGIELYWRERVAELQDAESVRTHLYGRRYLEARSPLLWGITKVKSGGDDHGVTYESGPVAEVLAHERAADRLAKLSLETVRAGIEAEKVQIAKEQGALVANAIRGIAQAIVEALRLSFPDMGDGLAVVVNETLAEAAPRALRMIQGGAA